VAIKKSRPTSPGRRFHTVQTFEELTTTTPEKSLTRGKSQRGGRSRAGRITVRFRGGGHKRRLRDIDFRRAKPEVPGRVASIEYDPNRSARIALLHYLDGEKRYILHAVGMQVGDVVVASDSAEIAPGNMLRIERIPLGATIHNVELRPGGGGKMARSAGAFVQLVAKEGRYAQVRLPSGEVRKVLRECHATIGQVSNVDHENVKLGKAGRKRWLGRRPHNRGVTMNPVDHPHGGGEGKSSGGRHPVSPWGVPTKGHKTRNNKRTDSMIVRSRRRRRR
jgi:large subunit ribosomal protein L2